MKMFKLGLITLGLTISTVTYSQDKEKKTPEQRAIQKTERMSKELLLSPEQKEKVLNLNTGIAQKNDAIRKSTSLSKEQKENGLKENKKARLVQLKTILNEEQFNKMMDHEAKKEQHHEKMKEAKEKEKNHKQKLEEKSEEMKEMEEEEEL